MISSEVSARDVRLLTQAGLGQAVSRSAGANTQIDSVTPGALAFAIDASLYGRFYIFAEHLRSLGKTGSSIGVTGIGFKYYPWLNPVQNHLIKSAYDKTQISTRGYLPFFGVGTGFAQASIMGNETDTQDNLAVTTYLSLKAGCEYSLSEQFGLNAEWNFVTSMAGSGSIQAVNLILGPYYMF
jgi:hypothetical protein